MIDINFYRQTYKLNQSMMSGHHETAAMDFVRSEYERCRSKHPIVYNIETTNACNMKCKMCPRTTKMTTPIKTMEQDTFLNVIGQIKPFSNEEWAIWKTFVEDTYGIHETDMGENHFFLYVIPRVIQLHGFGDPLLDTKIVERVRALTDRGLQSYFSCNPANIDVDKTERLFDAGLSYIKYSVESVDDLRHKKIRGDCSDFTASYDKIMKVLNIKKQFDYDTTIVITMLDLNNDKQQEEYDALGEVFKDSDIYIYLKSQDQQWYNTEEYHGTNSVHWSEICKHPWMSMTIKANADVAMCMEDYNNEIVLGNTKEDSLYNIWNGNKYIDFRKNHFSLKHNNKCTEECDMKLVGRCFGGI